MASITASGVASGLDVNSIVSQLMSIERQPLTALQKEQSSISAKISSFGKIQSALSTLRDKAGAFSSISTSGATSVWGQTSISVSDGAVATATAINGKSAAVGVYSLQVNSLAAAQAVSSAAFPPNAAILSEGSLTIELGAWTGGSSATGFNPKIGSSSVTIDVGAGETSLSVIRDKINKANAGVTAGIVTDASGVRLTLKSSATGVDNAFRIKVVEANGDGSPATGLSALAYDATTASPMGRNLVAANASVLIDGLAIDSASNNMENVIDGLSIKFNKVSVSPVEVTVSADNSGLKTALNEFVSAFNGLTDIIKTETKYDPVSKTAGRLQADRTATAVQGALRQMVFESLTSSGSALKSFSDIGVEFNSSGKLQINSSKLDSALLNTSAVKSLMTGGGAASTVGIMNRFKKYADNVLLGDGALQARTDGLNSQLKRNGERQDALNTRLVTIEDRLRKQYQTLDKKMSSLSTMSSAVSNISLFSFYG